MNFNKCKRCGCFFVANSDTCPACTTKDNNDISTLNNYFAENETNNIVSVNDLSNITGISNKNLTRFIENKDFNFKNNIKL